MRVRQWPSSLSLLGGGEMNRGDELDIETVANQVVERYFGPVCRIFRNRGFKADAEDHAQEVLFRFCQWVERNQELPQNTWNFLRVSAHRVLIDALRKRARTVRVERGVGSDQVDPPDKEAGGNQQRLETEEAVRIAVDRLPSREREVVELKLWRGLDFTEMARKFGYSERTYQRRWKKACARLREVLGVCL